MLQVMVMIGMVQIASRRLINVNRAYERTFSLGEYLMIRIKSTYFTVHILVTLLVVFGCMTQLGFAQQHLETLQTIILNDQRALQGITSDGEFFYTSTGTCTLDCGKAGSSIFRFDQYWLETDYQPLPLCHLGDISVDDTYVYVPSRCANFPAGPYEIRRFNRTTFEEAPPSWSLDAVAYEYSGEITAGLDIHDGDLFLIEYQEDGPDNAHIIHIDIAKLSVLGDYEISTRFANGIEFYGNYIYIANGSRDDPFGYGYIDVYDFEVMEHSGVNEPIATYSYDIAGGPCFGIGEHAEGLTFSGTELWVCAATGDEVRRIAVYPATVDGSVKPFHPLSTISTMEIFSPVPVKLSAVTMS